MTSLVKNSTSSVLTLDVVEHVYDNAVLLQIDTIISDFFNEARALVEYEEALIADNGFEIPKVDFSRLERFLFTAFHNFYEIDDRFVSALLVKSYRNIRYMIDFRNTLVKNSSNTDVLYTRLFVEKHPYLKKISDERVLLLSRRSSLEERMNYFDRIFAELKIKNQNIVEVKEQTKQNRSRYADAVHEYDLTNKRLDVINKELNVYESTYKSIFKSIFSSIRNDMFARLQVAINCEASIFDRLLWDCASKSAVIAQFLVSSSIEGAYETKTFIKYYIKNIDANNTMDKKWHKYLQEALRIME